MIRHCRQSTKKYVQLIVKRAINLNFSQINRCIHGSIIIIQSLEFKFAHNLHTIGMYWHECVCVSTHEIKREIHSITSF
jgi:hypothetical protein